jgi:hypothetical protein
MGESFEQAPQRAIERTFPESIWIRTLLLLPVTMLLSTAVYTYDSSIEYGDGFTVFHAVYQFGFPVVAEFHIAEQTAHNAREIPQYPRGVHIYPPLLCFALLVHFAVSMLVCYLFQKVLSQLHTTRNSTCGVTLLFFVATFVVVIPLYPPYEQISAIVRVGLVLPIPISAAIIGAFKRSYSVGLTASLLATLAYMWADRLSILYNAFTSDGLVPVPFQMHNLFAWLCFLVITCAITAICTFVAIRKST